jgi:hypothetical protein
VQTLKDIEAIPKDFLTPADVAGYLGCNPNSIRVQAHQDKSQLGFPVIVAGTRIKIPKTAFIHFMRGEN